MISELEECERPREKMLARGEGALTEAELLALILRSGTPGESVLTMARRLLADHQGSLVHLARAPASELQQTKGIGDAKACELRAVFELSRRMSAAGAHSERMRMLSPESVSRWVRDTVECPDQEEFFVLLLDTRGGLMQGKMISRGLLDRTSVHPREVFRLAVRHACSRMIVAHNHPSGDPTPSPQDIEVTRGLIEAGKVLGIALLDHVIVGSAAGQHREGFVSLRESNHVTFD